MSFKKKVQSLLKRRSSSSGRDFDEKKHNRYPKGHPLGGQFAPKEGSAASRAKPKGFSKPSIPDSLTELKLDDLALTLGDDLFKEVVTAPPRKTSEFAQKHRDKFNQAPENIQKLIDSIDEPGAAPKRPDSNSSYCNAEGIYLRPTASPDVYRHEYGHWIDRQLAPEGSGHLSNSPEFRAAAQKDAERILTLTGKRREKLGTVGRQASKELIRKVKTEQEALDRTPSFEDVGYELERQKGMKRLLELSKKYERPPTEVARHFANKQKDGVTKKIYDELERRGKMTPAIAAEMLAHWDDPRVVMKFGSAAVGDPVMGIDMIGALTRNKVGWGHSQEYYNKRGVAGQNTEAFANLFSMYSSGSPIAREVLGALVPSMLKEFEARFQSLSKDK